MGGLIIEICLFQIVLSGLAGRVDLYEHKTLQEGADTDDEDGMMEERKLQ